MEEVFDLYMQSLDQKRPLVCFDEVPKQLVLEKRAPLPTRPGQRARYDYEYQRNGVCNLFFFVSPSADGDMWRSAISDAPKTLPGR